MSVAFFQYVLQQEKKYLFKYRADGAAAKHRGTTFMTLRAMLMLSAKICGHILIKAIAKMCLFKSNYKYDRT